MGVASDTRNEKERRNVRVEMQQAILQVSAAAAEEEEKSYKLQRNEQAWNSQTRKKESFQEKTKDRAEKKDQEEEKDKIWYISFH